MGWKAVLKKIYKEGRGNTIQVINLPQKVNSMNWKTTLFGTMTVVSLALAVLFAVIAFAVPLSLTLNNVTSGNTYDSWQMPNISLNGTATSCSIFYTNNATLGSNNTATVMVNNSLGTGVNNSFIFPNGTIFTESVFGAQSGMTFSCFNGTDFSWYNSTNISSPINFTLNTISPTITSAAATQLNFTLLNLSSPMINATYVVTSNHISYCSVKIYSPDGATQIVNGTLSSSTVTNPTCLLNVTPSLLTGNGFFNLEYNATSTGNLTASASLTNRTGLVYTLKTGQWNLIGTFGNETLGGICNRIYNSSYVAWYNNSASYHNYTTYQCGATTNFGTTVPDGAGIYVSTLADVTAYNLNSTLIAAPAQLITSNISLTDSSWNIVGVYNATGRYLSQICNFNTTVIKYVSYNRISDNTYVTHKCGWDINNVSAPAGSAVWVNLLSPNNATFNMTITP